MVVICDLPNFISVIAVQKQDQFFDGLNMFISLKKRYSNTFFQLYTNCTTWPLLKIRCG